MTQQEQIVLLAAGIAALCGAFIAVADRDMKIAQGAIK